MSKYTKEQLMANLANKNEQERTNWVQSHTDEEIVDIMKTMIEIAENTPELAKDKNFIDKTTNLKIDVGLLENSIIDEQINDMMKEIQFQADMKAADEAYQNLRGELIQHLLQEPADEDSIEIARQFIEAEKANQDYYEEENWKEILHLL